MINNKAQVGALVFMLAIVVVICAIAFAPVVNEFSTKAMNQTSEIGGMDCTNSSITDFTKAGCWTLDLGQVYFIGGLIAIAGGLIAARVIWG